MPQVRQDVIAFAHERRNLAVLRAIVWRIVEARPGARRTRRRRTSSSLRAPFHAPRHARTAVPLSARSPCSTHSTVQLDQPTYRSGCSPLSISARCWSRSARRSSSVSHSRTGSAGSVVASCFVVLMGFFLVRRTLLGSASRTARGERGSGRLKSDMLSVASRAHVSLAAGGYAHAQQAPFPPSTSDQGKGFFPVQSLGQLVHGCTLWILTVTLPMNP